MLEFPVDDFFDTDDFASRAVYTDGDGHPSAIPVIFKSGYSEIEGIESVQPQAIAKTRDIPNAAQNDTLEINGTVYYIISPMPNGYGITRLSLSRDPV